MIGRVLRTEMRRGLPIWTFPVVLVASALPVADAVLWRPRWDATAAMLLHVLVPLLGMLLVAVGAWQGGRERRRRMTDLLGSLPRPRLWRALAAWLPVCAWPVLGYGLGLLINVGLLLSVPEAIGQPLPGLFAVAGLQLAFCAALGFTLGWYVPGRWVAPLAGVAGLGFWMLWVAPQASPGLVTSHTGSTGAPWEGPVSWYPPVVAVWFAGLAVALLALTAARWRWVAIVPLTAAVVAAVPIGLNQVWGVDTDSPLLTCAGVPVPICVGDGSTAKLDRVARSTRTVRTRMAGLPQAPLAYVWPMPPCVPGNRVLSNCSPEGGPGRAGTEMARRIATIGACVNSDWPKVRAAHVDNRLARGVQGWLLGRSRGAPEVTGRIAAMPAGQRDAWLKRYLDAVADCDIPRLKELAADTGVA